MTASINMKNNTLTEVMQHLFPKGDRREQGGFLFCNFDAALQRFEVLEWQPLQGSDYAFQERDYLELADDTRAALIKKAHDMQASLVEVHCHPGQHKVAFSIADWMGFKDFVPHIRWRLAKRPYAALVFGQACVDGFAWIDDSKTPIAIKQISTETTSHATTGISINAFVRGHYEQI